MLQKKNYSFFILCNVIFRWSFWRVLLEHFVEHKHLISKVWQKYPALLLPDLLLMHSFLSSRYVNELSWALKNVLFSLVYWAEMILLLKAVADFAPKNWWPYSTYEAKKWLIIYLVKLLQAHYLHQLREKHK